MPFWKFVPALVFVALAAGAGEPRVELGKVPWLRSFDAAVKQAAAATKPLFVLFDEVPG